MAPYGSTTNANRIRTAVRQTIFESVLAGFSALWPPCVSAVWLRGWSHTFDLCGTRSWLTNKAGEFKEDREKINAKCNQYTMDGECINANYWELRALLNQSSPS